MSRIPPATRTGLSRRELIGVVGYVGLGAAVTACSRGTIPMPVSENNSSIAPAPVETSAASSAVVSPEHAGPAPASLLCRSAWGARPARPGGRKHTIARMTLHHSGIVLGDNRNAVQRLQEHQRYHQEDLGWIDIAYHVGIDRGGRIFELRATELAGDTATEYDPTGHFLVMCEGDYNQETVSEAQLHSLAVVFAWSAQKFQIKTETLLGHRDLAATACPGENLYAHIASGELKRRIDDLLAVGTIDLRPVCGSEAAEILSGG